MGRHQAGVDERNLVCDDHILLASATIDDGHLGRVRIRRRLGCGHWTFYATLSCARYRLQGRHLMRYVILLASAVGALVGPSAARASEPCNIGGLQAIAPADTRILSVQTMTAPAAYCAVRGFVETKDPGPNQVHFELALPAGWNGRFYFGGSGGAGGVILDPPENHVAEGYAAVAEDTGHKSKLVGRAAVLDWSPMYKDEGKKIDYGYRSVHVVAQSTQAITRAFYHAGKMPRYYRGCSKGGAQGLAEIQRFPKDFDGLVIGAPGVYGVMPSFATIARFEAHNRQRFLSGAKLKLLETVAIAACDAKDGAKDGLISDPPACAFNPAKLLCKPGRNQNCLTGPEVAMARFIIQEKRTRGGTFIYPGYPVSNPTSWVNLVGAVPPDAPNTPIPWTNPSKAPMSFTVPSQMLRYVYADNPDYNLFEQFDPTEERTFNWFIEGHKRTGNWTDTADVRPFVEGGGKLLLWHGWSDPALSPFATIRFYEAMQQALGGKAAMDSFSRLYTVPGTEHCRGGSGPQDMPDRLLESMIDWVEHGQAPAQITSYRPASPDRPARTFLACPFPQKPQFKGGSVDDAKNYVCATS